jgi:putative flippase GtrA
MLLMHINLGRDILKLFAGFSIVGLLNTLLSLGLMYICLKLLDTSLILTYIVIYFTTILISFFLNSRFVFNSGLSFSNGLKYLIVYVSSMFMGTFLLWVLKKILPFENYILAYLTIPFTMIWNFVLFYKILKSREKC